MGIRLEVGVEVYGTRGGSRKTRGLRRGLSNEKNKELTIEKSSKRGKKS